MNHPSLPRPLVLAVDDNLDNLWLLSMALEMFGFSHICINQSQYVMEAAKRYQPDLILLDLVMADINGIEVANYLKVEPTTVNIPIVGVTAMVTYDYPKCLPIEIFDSFLTKPYLLDDLQDLVKASLKKQAPYCLTPRV
ncbi:MAG: response regulator [Cyanobacteria bacterium P01_A01_bin.15]